MSAFLRRHAPALACCLLVAFFVATYHGAYTTYRSVNLAFGNKAYWFPFLDTDTVLSAVRCLRADVDAYVFNPCDPQLRVFTYSPLWMGLTALPITEAWLPWMGMAWVLGYLGALFLLPEARSRGAALAMIAATCSSVSVYAMERGNNDIVIFALVSLAAVLFARQRKVQWIGYALVLAAGLLKYYPLGAMVVALRERPRRFLGIAALSVAITLLAIYITWADLVRVLKSIPVGQFYTDMFGSESVGRTLVELFGLPKWVHPVTRAALSFAAVAVGLWLGLKGRISSDVARLTDRERSFLLLGSLMTCLCYFSAQNIGYRAINLILVLPAITALAVVTGRRGYRWLAAAVIVLLWTGAWRYFWEDSVMAGVGLYEPKRYVALFVRDALWWAVIPVLIGAIVALLRDGPIPQAVLKPLGLARG
ncbi:glycosyltransferase 87 family protein [Novosphingobium sp. TH158]|uniref:glycosyltransferase 87 family protein n=1 Tax=Novosphingobium sp. TH158 TaxID=2067455 RepID=UPI000C7A9676|nr:glycosyltransferase 87 family protein [Novosphingobium sp. TH158]PLK26850.1 hypothetical protein C0V78_08065 [Novosphingobium sp. TH158]